MKYILCVLILVCSLTYAQPQLYIFFINGVNTTPDEANMGLSKLESLVDTESDSITWNVLYNQTHGLVKSDIWDVVRQKHQERLGLWYEQYLKKYPHSSLSDYLDDRHFVGRNLADLVNQFHKRMPSNLTDAYILILSHSQGNQYANQLWDYLVNAEGFPESRIGLIGIASPTDRGYGESFYYVTADNDKVINAVRIFPDPPMPSNVHIKNCYSFSCHNLINDYLSDYSIRQSLCKHIGSFMNLWLNAKPLC